MSVIPRLIILITLSVLFLFGYISESFAIEFSTGFHPISTAESYIPTTGWSGAADDIKINDNIPFINTYIGAGNVNWIYSHVTFPTIPPEAIIKRFNFKMKAKHDGGLGSGGGGSVSYRKSCTSGVQNSVYTQYPLYDTFYTTKIFTLVGSGGFTVTDLNNQTACFIPTMSIDDGGVNYFDYFEAEVIYEIPDATATPTHTPSPTPTPTPTTIPTPEPFLELPYDYKSLGKKFNDVALNPESWFDHQYPLQNVFCCVQTVLTYTGIEKNLPYRSHAGYDYASKNGVEYLTPVRAAANGIAEFKPANKTGGLGNIIKIDHGNGYQTWYGHLDPLGLIVATEGNTIAVTQGQEIGKTGYTGNIFPQNKYGAHIHFAVLKDENNNDIFNDDYPYGLTDPLGWEGDSIDPWTEYENDERNGVTSHNLFLSRTNPILQTISKNDGGSITSGETTISVPPNALPLDFIITFKYGPFESENSILESIAPSFFLYAKTVLGDSVTQFLQPIQIIYNYAEADLLNINEDSLKLFNFNEQTKQWEALPIINHNKIAKTITTETMHFSQFALMGEVKDRIAPVTEVLLQGSKGQSDWYRSSVSVELFANDGDNGSGAHETLYTLNGKDWFTYTVPLVFEDEGRHTLTYQSIDKVGNLEDQKTKIFYIDKTSPEVEIGYDLSKFDIVVMGKDSTGSVTVTTAGTGLQTKFTVSDEAGNKLVINTDKVKVGKQVTLTLKNLQYNSDPILKLDRNNFFTLVLTDRNNTVKQLDQYFSMKGDKRIFTNYSSQKNQTKIYTKSSGSSYVQEVKQGMVLLKLFTQKGTIISDY